MLSKAIHHRNILEKVFQKRQSVPLLKYRKTTNGGLSSNRNRENGRVSGERNPTPEGCKVVKLRQEWGVGRESGLL